MDKAIDFKIKVASLVVRLKGNYEETPEFCKEYFTDDEDVDIFVNASAEDVDGEISRQAGGGSREYYEKIYLYRQIAEQLPKFDGCQVHSTVMLSEVDRKIFKKLGVGLTCDPVKKN